MNGDDAGMTRRDLLAAGAGGTLAGLVSETEPAIAAGADDDIYARLGVRPIINAAGTITTMGGSLMPPEVVEAWRSASRRFVPLLELQDRIGESIARLLKVEAALVTTGAAGGITVGTAAALTARHPDRVGKLPLGPDEGLEVICQKAHRECYNHQVTACGVAIREVETRAELDEAIGPKTAMMLAYNVHEPAGAIRHAEWLAVARRHGVITLLDAAADAPPVERLWQYSRMGYDLVVFSGGKALRGPQDAGLLLGRKDLIEAAKKNTAPHCNNIGRGMKVSKEDMVAMWAAVERFVKLDHAAEHREWERRIEVIAEAVAGVDSVRTTTITPPVANHVPHLLVDWDQGRVPVTPAAVKQRLAAGSWSACSCCNRARSESWRSG